MGRIDLVSYARQLADSQGRQTMLPVVEKELLHYEILLIMREGGFLDKITFQGGTCLRLCYGAQRYSEDLDFAGGPNFNAKDFASLKGRLEAALPTRYAIEATVKPPRGKQALVSNWLITINTVPTRPDIASQKISLQIAGIPAYSIMPRFLQVNYDRLPQSYADVVIACESETEILADKLESFICSQHCRFRDLWDINWLCRRNSVDLPEAYAMREQKALDYGEQKRFEDQFPVMLTRIPEIIEGKEFAQQMRRFIPMDLYNRTIGDSLYRQAMIDQIVQVFAAMANN